MSGIRYTLWTKLLMKGLAMKGSSLAALLFSLLMSVLPNLASAADGWYGAFDLGRSHFTSLVGGDGPFPSNFFVPYTVDDTDTTYRLAAGYRFNSYLGLEGGYANLGKAEQFAILTLFSEPGIPPTVIKESNDLRVHGYLAEVIGTLPLGFGLSLYARAGGFASHVENINSSPGTINPGVRNTDFTYTHTSVTYGAGIGWSYSDRFEFRLGWDDYGTLGNTGGTGTTGRFRVSSLALGVLYSFQ